VPKFFLAYHGATPPKTAEGQEASIRAWGVWMETYAAALVDPGNPVGMSLTVLGDGSVAADGGANPLSGYSIIEAPDTDAALAIAKACPILMDGGTVEVAPLMEM
jgi:hypothetical protein